MNRDRKKFHEWNEAIWESPPDLPEESEPTTRPDDWPYPTIDPTCAQDLK